MTITINNAATNWSLDHKFVAWTAKVIYHLTIKNKKIKLKLKIKIKKRGFPVPVARRPDVEGVRVPSEEASFLLGATPAWSKLITQRRHSKGLCKVKKFKKIQNKTVQGSPHPLIPYPNNAMQCNAMQCNATQRNATQRNATQRNATQRNATQRNAMQYIVYLQHRTQLHHL